MIFLSNEHIAQVLDMKACIDAMGDAYRELNELKAGYRPRIDFYVPDEPHYYWGTMEGASLKLGMFAIRMKSDMLASENQDGFHGQRQILHGARPLLRIDFSHQHAQRRAAGDHERRLLAAYARRASPA